MEALRLIRKDRYPAFHSRKTRTPINKENRTRGNPAKNSSRLAPLLRTKVEDRRRASKDKGTTFRAKQAPIHVFGNEPLAALGSLRRFGKSHHVASKHSVAEIAVPLDETAGRGGMEERSRQPSRRLKPDLLSMIALAPTGACS